MNVMLKVAHRGRDQYVGKVYRPRGRSMDVFLHEERTPSQHMIVHDSPGGVDACVLAFLRKNGVSAVWHRPAGANEAYAARVDDILTKGIRRHLDGRDRYFLPWENWTPFPLTGKSPYIEREYTVPAILAQELQPT